MEKGNWNAKFDFTPFFSTIKEMGISTYSLVKDYGFSNGMLDNLRKNKSVCFNTIVFISNSLHIETDKIFRFYYTEE